MPTKLQSWLYSLFKTVPSFPKDKKLDESRFTLEHIDSRTISKIADSLEASGGKLSLNEANRLDSIPGGVPAGAATSPFLSILAIRGYLSQQTCVNYADDQIFYGDKIFHIKDEPENGIIHNQDKSG